MRILVCGGRDYRDSGRVYAALDLLHARRGITCIIEGGAPGADKLAAHWAKRRGIECQTFVPEWRRGPKAGPERNRRMLGEGRPDGVVAFPGGPGTADMCRAAMDRGLAVWRPFGHGPQWQWSNPFEDEPEERGPLLD